MSTPHVNNVNVSHTTDAQALAALRAEMERLQAENQALRAKAYKALSFKVSEKGALSVYGINSRFPVTLYRDQWQRLIEAVPALSEFMRANASMLAIKGEEGTSNNVRTSAPSAPNTR